MTLSEQLKSLVEKATPGPWRFETDVSHFDSAAVVARDGFIGANYYRRDADALLVVALLNNLPTILAALEAVENTPETNDAL